MQEKNTTTLSNEQANDLIKIPKYVYDHKEIKIETVLEKPGTVWDTRIKLIANKHTIDPYFFLWQIKQNEKRILKISLHFQKNNENIGLLRIDYNNTHKNPSNLTNTVPSIFHPFAGKIIKEHHIHYHVEGYKPLAWALPLTKEHFPIIDIQNQSQILEIINNFAKKINLQTNIIIPNYLPL